MIMVCVLCFFLVCVSPCATQESVYEKQLRPVAVFLAALQRFPPPRMGEPWTCWLCGAESEAGAQVCATEGCGFSKPHWDNRMRWCKYTPAKGLSPGSPALALYFFEDSSSANEFQRRSNWRGVMETLLAPEGERTGAEAAQDLRDAKRSSFRSPPSSLHLPVAYLLDAPSESLPAGYVAPWYGETLQDWLARDAPVWRRDRSLLFRLQLAKWVAEGVQTVHSRNVLHCDIKPGNVLLTRPSEQVRTMEAGPGLVLTGFSSSLPCQPGSNLRYDNPPIWSEHTPSHDINRYTRSRYLNWRTDVFALALTCWQIILGQPGTPDMGSQSPTALLQCIEMQRDGRQEAFFQALYHCVGHLREERSSWMLLIPDSGSMAEHMLASPVRHASVNDLLQTSTSFAFRVLVFCMSLVICACATCVCLCVCVCVCLCVCVRVVLSFQNVFMPVCSV